MIHLSHAPTNIVEVEGAPESNPTFLNLLLRFLDVGGGENLVLYLSRLS